MISEHGRIAIVSCSACQEVPKPSVSWHRHAHPPGVELVVVTVVGTVDGTVVLVAIVELVGGTVVGTADGTAVPVAIVEMVVVATAAVVVPTGEFDINYIY